MWMLESLWDIPGLCILHAIHPDLLRLTQPVTVAFHSVNETQCKRRRPSWWELQNKFKIIMTERYINWKMFLLQLETSATQETFLRGNKDYPWSDNFKTTHTYTHTYSHMQYVCQQTNRTETVELCHRLHRKSRLQFFTFCLAEVSPLVALYFSMRDFSINELLQVPREHLGE